MRWSILPCLALLQHLLRHVSSAIIITSSSNTWIVSKVQNTRTTIRCSTLLGQPIIVFVANHDKFETALTFVSAIWWQNKIQCWAKDATSYTFEASTYRVTSSAIWQRKQQGKESWSTRTTINFVTAIWQNGVDCETYEFMLCWKSQSLVALLQVQQEWILYVHAYWYSLQERLL
jgi:hypothetical protein